ncbi:class I SAM-dependent methyltransferase [Paludibaculum fermentans]|uniref:class I SAM-dependent methyltransferase n=1 Tax=Paludibaculum fermentans TaxID=1473598 RepID=UPI003EB83590
MQITRTGFLMGLAGIGGAAAQTQPRPKMHRFERQPLKVADFDAEGYVLDIGGGGEGIIGRMKPSQVVAIDLYKNELMESPAGPLKIVMDATEMKFLDGQFATATAFFSLMYMQPEVQRKVFAETARVLKPGGRWMVWDAVLPMLADPGMEQGTKGPLFYFEFHLPREVVKTGYGTLWPQVRMDLPYYRSLAEAAGFRIALAEETGGQFRTFRMELRKA